MANINNNLHKRFEKSIKKQVKTKMEYKYTMRKMNKQKDELSSTNERLTEELSNIQKKYLKAKNKLKEQRNLNKELTETVHNKTSPPVVEKDNKSNPNPQCKTVTVESKFNIMTYIVLISFTFIFVKLSCYAANVNEESSQFIATNVLGMQIMFMTVYYNMFKPHKETIGNFH